MPGYNTKFELSVEDMDLIETALRNTGRRLSASLLARNTDPLLPGDEARAVDLSVKRINDLLGRLHNQKRFYRPKSGAYVSG